MRFWAITTAVVVGVVSTFAKPLEETYAQFHWGKDGVAMEAFEIELQDPGKIQIVDFKMNGDAFSVYDNGELLGETPAIDPFTKSNAFAATPEEAEDDTRFSQAVYELEEGSHVITIRSLGAFESGTAAIRLVPRLQKEHSSAVNVNEELFHGHQHHEQSNDQEEKQENRKANTGDGLEDSSKISDDSEQPRTLTKTKTHMIFELPSPAPSNSIRSAIDIGVSVSISLSASLYDSTPTSSSSKSDLKSSRQLNSSIKSSESNIRNHSSGPFKSTAVTSS